MKRRGPLLWIAGRSRRFWLAVLGVPVVYVASLPVLFYVHHHLHLIDESIGGVVFDAYVSPALVADRWLPPEWHEQLWRFLLMLVPT